MVAPPRFSAFNFLNGQVGWVAGHGAGPGTVQSVLLGTQDGGHTWTGLTAPGSIVLQLKFLDATHGWAVAGTHPSNYGWADVAIFATPDGGKSWSQQWEGPWPKSLENITMLMRVRIQFFGSKDGLILVGGDLLTTGDGGATWHPVTFPTTSFAPVDGSFVDARTGWVAGQEPDPNSSGGSRPLVLATKDSGKTWTESFSAPKGTPYWAYSSTIAFVDGRHGWLHFKGDDLRGFMYQTADGGRTWKPLQAPGALTGRTVAGTPTFLNKDVGWLPISGGASPFAGTILITQDGGKTWTAANTPGEDWSAGALALISSREAWVMTDRPTGQDQELLLHTTDGGQTWHQVLPQSQAAAGS